MKSGKTNSYIAIQLLVHYAPKKKVNVKEEGAWKDMPGSSVRTAE